LALSYWPRVKRKIKNDYSYGCYIYGFPISQLVVLLLPKFSANWLYLAVTVLIFTFLASWASWRYIEEPSLRLKVQ
jgi:peptidoglycan/LPS O-acetylase OafA/YrhL